MRQDLAGYDLIADYLLYYMNKRRQYQYLKLTDLDEPTDDIRKLLFEIALKYKMVIKGPGYDNIRKVLDLEGAAQKLLTWYRDGNFGCQFLDHDFLGEDDIL